MAEYYVPARDSETEFTEKRSRFIGHVWRVEQEEEAREKIAQMKAKHYDARHNCWCYLIREGGIVRYSDDGEPQGTAGQPMLEVFRRAGVENVCCVVTRYFGGILLGTGGCCGPIPGRPRTRWTRRHRPGPSVGPDGGGMPISPAGAGQAGDCRRPGHSGGGFVWRPGPPARPAACGALAGLRGPDHGTDRRQDHGGEAGETFQAAPVEVR